MIVMSIADLPKKIKSKSISNYLSQEANNLFIISLVLLVGSLGFGLWQLSKIEKGIEPIRIEQLASMSSSDSLGAGQAVVASKSGSKYHLPWCSGAQRIKPENLITFTSRDEAERAGYTPAANCKGL